MNEEKEKEGNSNGSYIERRSLDAKSLDLLCKEFCSLYSDDLVAVSLPLEELTRNQSVLLETMQHENDRFSDTDITPSLEDTFTKLSHYHDKLVNIKKDMLALHDKVSKLKKRAARIQEVKEKQKNQRK